MAVRTIVTVGIAACIAILVDLNSQYQTLTPSDKEVDIWPVVPRAPAEGEIHQRTSLSDRSSSHGRSSEEASRGDVPDDDHNPAIDRVAEQPWDQQYRLEELTLPVRPEIDRLRQRFSSETIDPVWSSIAERLIYEKIAEMQRGVQTIDVQCKTTLCRIQLTLAGQVASKPDALSLPAMIYGSALARAIPDEDLITVLRTSGFNGYGVPIVLFYLQKAE